jgi:hypothetical protein
MAQATPEASAPAKLVVKNIGLLLSGDLKATSTPSSATGRRVRTSSTGSTASSTAV